MHRGMCAHGTGCGPGQTWSTSIVDRNIRSQLLRRLAALKQMGRAILSHTLMKVNQLVISLSLWIGFYKREGHV